MASIKSGVTRTLRSTPSSNPRVLNTVSRHLTRTATNASSIETTTQPQLPAPFFTPDFNHTTYLPPPLAHQHTAFQRPTSTPPPTTKFDTLVSDITNSLLTTPKPDLPHLTRLLRSYDSIPSHFLRYAHADPSIQYTRNLVASVDGVFNLLLLVWNPANASPVHDHADAHCLMKVLKGELRERRYAIPTYPGKQGQLVKTSELNFKLNQVSYMADVLGLHEISNPSSTEYAMSLHLYTPPNAATRGCRVYEKGDGSMKHVMQGEWHSVGGKLVRK